MKFEDAKLMYIKTTSEARKVDEEIVHIIQTMFDLESEPGVNAYEIAVLRTTFQRKSAKFNELFGLAMAIPRMIVQRTSFAQTLRNWNAWLIEHRKENKR